MGKYLYTIQITIEAFDDIEARSFVKSIKDTYKIDDMKLEGLGVKEVNNKLQEINFNKPPRKIEL